MKRIQFAFFSSACLLLASAALGQVATEQTAWKVYALQPAKLDSPGSLSQKFVGALKLQRSLR